MTKTEVMQLQARLNELGFGPITADGQYGKQTEKAYRKYLDEMDSSTPTVIPKPDKKWWHSKAAVGSIATVLASVFGMVGYSVDASFLSEMILALITLITGAAGLYGTVTRDASIEKQLLPHRKPAKSENTDPRGVFGDDW